MQKALSPWIDGDAEILILGSFPSIESLAQQMYYSNSKNQFWKIMKSIYLTEIGNDVLSQKAFLKEYKLGLWDVLASCDREGSSDKKITNEIPNDLEKFVQDYPCLKKIIINGISKSTGSVKYFNRYNKKKQGLNKFEVIFLPQTSSMSTKYNLVQKTEIWKDALAFR